jgi:hypothetical protein
MKYILTLVIVSSVLSVHAKSIDSLFHHNQISFSIANGISQEFMSDPNNKPTTQFNYSPAITGSLYRIYIQEKYQPLYAMHLQIRYSYGVSSLLRIETGISYLLSGSLIRLSNGDEFASGYERGSQNNYSYTGSIVIPIELKLSKAIRHGVFTCTLGPQFTLPVHSFQHIKDNMINDTLQPDFKTHERYKTSLTKQFSTLGFDLKLGYEKKLNSNVSINIGPVIDFFNLVYFRNNNDVENNSSGYHPYQFYAGVDVAVDFGFMIVTKSGRY